MDAVLIGPYEFLSAGEGRGLLPKAGIYAVVHEQEGAYELLDMQHADNVREHWQDALETSDRTDCPGKITVAAYYTDMDPAQRKLAIDEILSELDEQPDMSQLVTELLALAS